MGINKVQYGNTTLIDLTSDTVTADKLMQGYTAHDRSGAIITGTATGGGTGVISVVDTEDTHGGTIRTITALDISDTTAVASDVAQGKYFYTADGTKTTGTASGGGATNIVEGTFIGTTTGQAIDISLNYSGNGYPIAVMIFPTEPLMDTTSAFYNLMQRYVTGTFSLTKAYNAIPTYNNDGITNNQAFVVNRYKNSTADSITYGSGSRTAIGYYSNVSIPSGANNVDVMRIKSNTVLSVYIANTSFGFAPNIEYTYCVLYSN